MTKALAEQGAVNENIKNTGAKKKKKEPKEVEPIPREVKRVA